VSARLIDFQDAAATAARNTANPGMLYLGFAVFMVEMACQIIATALFYVLLKPVSRSLSLTAAFLGLAGCVIKILSRLFFIAPLLVLGSNAPHLRVFNTEQLQALSLLLLGINDRGASIALVFFGFATPFKGYLMYRSTFLPRFLGVLSMISGAGWLTFLYPPLGYRSFPIVAGFGLLVSVILIFWLLVFAVDENRWKASATAAEVRL
jgi:hypothetical protein